MKYPDRIRIDRANRVLDEASYVLRDPDRIKLGDIVAVMNGTLKPRADEREIGIITRIEPGYATVAAFRPLGRGKLFQLDGGMLTPETKGSTFMKQGAYRGVLPERLRVIRSTRVEDNHDGTVTIRP